jgi:hypothetical protein
MRILQQFWALFAVTVACCLLQPAGAEGTCSSGTSCFESDAAGSSTDSDDVGSDSRRSSRDFVNFTWVDGKCEPDICGGAHMPDILGLVTDDLVTGQHIPNRVIKRLHWYDTHRTLRCFQNKLITLLGDSTTCETVITIGVLLTGRAGEEARNLATKLKSTEQATVWVDGLTKGNITYPNVSLAFYGGAKLFQGPSGERFVPSGSRNMTITVPDWDITVRFRFNGEGHIHANLGGIASLNDPEFVPEFACLYGEPGTNCRVPDILAIQSGFHEAHDVARFESHIDGYMARLAAIRDRGTKVIWKGAWNFTNPHLQDDHPMYLPNGPNYNVHQVDCMAEQAAAKNNIPYVNVRDWFAEASTWGLHLEKELFNLPHMGVISRFPVGGALSAFMVQELLRAMCR